MFLYKDKLFQQHDGVSMGSPLAPTMANFFWSSLENKLLQTQSEFYPKLYLRYVDNIFAVFDNDEKCSKFLDLLNTQHKNIKFTMEHLLETIPFLDVEIKINDTGIETWVYKKPTNTKLFLNFNAMCPTKWKSGLIFCLFNRTERICSSNFSFDNEIKLLKSVFLNNGNPIWFFVKILKQFLCSNQRSAQYDDKTYENCIIIPCIGKDSYHFAKRISALISNRFNLKMLPIFKTLKYKIIFCKIRELLRLCVQTSSINSQVRMTRT